MICGIIVLLFMTVPWIAVFGMCSRKGFLRPCESLVLAFAVAPVSVSYILWLLMMAFPGRLSSLQIFWIVAGIFLAGNVILFRQTAESLRRCRRELSGFIAVHQIGRRAVWVFVGMMFLAVLGLTIYAEIGSILNFDVVEYVLGGDMFYKSRAIVYNGCFVDPQNGFWYHTYHSFLFPLFGTWGNILTEVLSVPKDWYFKFIMVFYWLVLNLYAMVLFGKHIKSCRDLVIAGCGLAFLDFVPVTFDFILFYGIDFFRVTFFTVTCVFLYRTLRKPTWNNVIFLGFFASFSMAAHGLQVIFTSVILLPLLLLFFRRDISHWGAKLAVLAGMIFLLAGSHYLLMMLWGDGWLWAAAAAAAEATVGSAKEQYEQYAKLGYIVIMFGISWLLLLIPSIDLLKIRSMKLFSLAEKSLIVCFAVITGVAAYFLSFNYRYWYTQYPSLIIGLWCMILAHQVYRTAGRIATVAILQIFLTLCCCGVMMFMDGHSTTSFKSRFETIQKLLFMNKNNMLPVAAPAGIKKTTILPDPANPFDLLPDGASGVMVLARNKILMRKATFPVYYCGYDGALCLQYLFHADFCDSPARFKLFLRKHSISYVIVEKSRLTLAHQASFEELRKHFRVLFESKNYCIFTMDKKAKGELL